MRHKHQNEKENVRNEKKNTSKRGIEKQNFVETWYLKYANWITEKIAKN